MLPPQITLNPLFKLMQDPVEFCRHYIPTGNLKWNWQPSTCILYSSYVRSNGEKRLRGRRKKDAWIIACSRDDEHQLYLSSYLSFSLILSLYLFQPAISTRPIERRTKYVYVSNGNFTYFSLELHQEHNKGIFIIITRAWCDVWSSGSFPNVFFYWYTG